jgi:hypothetical protein
MKTKIYTILFFALALSSALIFNSCTKNSPTCIKHTYTIEVSQDDESKINYTGTDTLIFVSNTNDTAKCIGNGKIVLQDCQNAGGSPDCPSFTNTNCYNSHVWNFINSSNLLSITERLFCPGENTSSSVAYNFSITINSIYTFYTFATCISDPTCSNFLPSVVFNGKQYNNVTFLYRDFTNNTSKIYLSQSQGIIRIELNNQQQVWTLK